MPSVFSKLKFDTPFYSATRAALAHGWQKQIFFETSNPPRRSNRFNENFPAVKMSRSTPIQNSPTTDTNSYNDVTNLLTISATFLQWLRARVCVSITDNADRNEARHVNDWVTKPSDGIPSNRGSPARKTTNFDFNLQEKNSVYQKILS